MKKPLIPSILVIAAVAAAAAALGARWAHAAQAQPGDLALTLIGQDRVTAVYTFSHEGHTCFIASTRGGSGISLQCPR